MAGRVLLRGEYTDDRPAGDSLEVPAVSSEKKKVAEDKQCYKILLARYRLA